MDWGDHFAKLSLRYAAVGILLVDEDGEVKFANARAEEFFQLPSKSMEGMNLHTLIHTSSARSQAHSKLKCTQLHQVNQNGSFLRQSDVFWRNKHPFWVEYSIYPLIDEKGIRASLVSFLDAEIAFRGKENYMRSRAKFRMTFEMSHDPKVILNNEGIIEEANPAALSFFAKDQIISENFFTLFPKEGKVKLKDLWKNRKQRSIRLYPLEFITETNDEIFIEMTIVPEMLPNTSLIIFRDTTARVLEQRQRDRFLALVGHELRTPLAVIKAFTQLLQSTTKDFEDKKIDRYLQHIHEKTDLLTGLINGMMDAIHLGSGKLQFDDQPVVIDELLQQIVFEFKKTFPSANFILVGETTQVMLLDKHRITQVISNLITNAIKYSPQPATVHIRIQTDENKLIISIQDQGRGIPKSEQSKLFLPFFRGKAARVGKTQGLGLGLYLARQVMRHYKGSMAVESKYGKGSTFSLTFFLQKTNA